MLINSLICPFHSRYVFVLYILLLRIFRSALCRVCSKIEVLSENSSASCIEVKCKH